VRFFSSEDWRGSAENRLVFASVLSFRMLLNILICVGVFLRTWQKPFVIRINNIGFGRLFSSIALFNILNMIPRAYTRRFSYDGRKPP